MELKEVIKLDETERDDEKQAKELEELIEKNEFQEYEITNNLNETTEEEKSEIQKEIDNIKGKYKRLIQFYKDNNITDKKQLKEVQQIKKLEEIENSLNTSLNSVATTYNNNLVNNNIVRPIKRRNKEQEEFINKIEEYKINEIKGDREQTQNLKKFIDVCIEKTETINLNSDEYTDIVINLINEFLSNLETNTNKRETKSNYIDEIEEFILYATTHQITRDYNIIKKGIKRSSLSEEEKRNELQKLINDRKKAQEEVIKKLKLIFIAYRNKINKELYDETSEINDETKDNEKILKDMTIGDDETDSEAYTGKVFYFSYLDYLQFLPGTLNIIAGRPSAGKTTTLINMFSELLAQKKHHNSVFMTTETRERKIIRKLLKKELRERVRVNDDIQEYFNGNYDHIIKEFFIGDIEKSDPRYATLKEVETYLTNKLVKQNEKHKIFELNKFKGNYRDFLTYLKSLQPYTVVFLDYIQDLKLLREIDDKGDKIKTTYEQIEKTLEDIKKISVKQNLIIILGSQFNRETTDREIKLSNLAKSGKLELITDIVIGLNKYYEKGDDKPTYIYKLLKNREGDITDEEYKIVNDELKYCLYYPSNEIIDITQKSTKTEETQKNDFDYARKWINKNKGNKTI